MTEPKFDPNLDDDKAKRTLIGADSVWPTSEKWMVTCGNHECASHSANSFDPLRGVAIKGRRFYAPDIVDGQVWLCPSCVTVAA